MNAFRDTSRLASQLNGLRQWAAMSFALGVAVNLLSFVSPLFMMQIMDTIIPSQDRNTLFILLGFGAAAFVFLAVLDAMRRIFSIKAAAWTESRLTEAVLSSANAKGQAMGGVRQIVAFLRSGANTLIDAPISLIAFLVLWLIHPQFAVIAAVTAVVMIATSFFKSSLTSGRAAQAGEQRKGALALADAVSDADATAASMGIGRNVEKKFLASFSQSLTAESTASADGEYVSAFSKFVRQFAQIAALTAGAVLVMQGALSGGAMIAASIIMGKALAPFDQLSSAWDSFTSAMKAATHISAAIASSSPSSAADEKITPDQIKPVLKVENITVPRSAGAAPILDRINFTLHPGECLAIVGASGAGKSTLGEIIAGVTKPPVGEISLDGIPFEQIRDEKKAEIIGYAPQSVRFFPGTITENISRFCSNPDHDDVFDAVSRSGTEILIRDLPNGFDTQVDAKGRPLSSGNARRLLLARAVFGRPRLVMLDEPSSDLDETGEKALVSLIGKLKSEGAAVVLIAQRAGLLAVSDKLMQLEDGRLRDFGEKNEVLMRLSMKRRQIDLAPTIDECTRLLHWLSIHLARADDGPLRARAELALIEIFQLLRQREGVSDQEKISVMISFAGPGVNFHVHCSGKQPLFTNKDRQLIENLTPVRDINDLAEDELSRLVALSAARDLKEEVIDNRLHISFRIDNMDAHPALSAQKVAV